MPVGQEKELSELGREVIAELSHLHADPHPRGPVAVAACVAGEQHELGLRMIIGLLRERGQRVHFLGADVDSRFLTEVIQLRRPAAVLLSATTEARLPDLAAAIEVVRGSGTTDETPVVVGGWASPDGVRRFGSRVGALPVVGDSLDAVLTAIGTPGMWTAAKAELLQSALLVDQESCGGQPFSAPIVRPAMK